jgi:uncharacterized protein YijF (DUF1287 family)
MKINNGWSVAVVTSATLVLAACSGNPVDDKSVVPKTSATAAKVVKKADAYGVTTKKIVATANKKNTVGPAPATKKTKVVRVVKAKTKTKTLSRAASNAKKRVIASLGKVKRAPVKRKTFVNQSVRVAQANTERRRGIQVANSTRYNMLGLDRFTGSQADNTQANTRSPQPVATRSKQPVATRAKQPVRTRAQIQFAKNQQLQARRAAAQRAATSRSRPFVRKASFKRVAKRPAIARIDPNVKFGYALSNAAIERTKHRVRYDGAYVKIGYPWGDVPKTMGVCTDVVIRAYRRLGIDLQQEVHKDISSDFYAYPNVVKWGLTKPDPNIDHRRVYNLQAFFKRHKAELPRTRNPRNYKPGDLVTWMVGPSFPHIGVVVNKPSKADPNRLMIAHNIGNGPQIEDILFRFPMTGHYRYTPKNRQINPSLIFAKTPPPASVLKRQRNRSLSYAELLQASKLLTGNTQARAKTVSKDLLTKNSKVKKPQERIMLAHLDASIFNSAGINQDAIQALLK